MDFWRTHGRLTLAALALSTGALLLVLPRAPRPPAALPVIPGARTPRPAPARTLPVSPTPRRAPPSPSTRPPALLLDPRAYTLSDHGQTFAAMARDGTGRLYVTGSVTRPVSPTVPGGPTQTDLFVAVIGPDLHTLLASTTLGGNGTSRGTAIALGPHGLVLVAGVTTAHDFPTTAGASLRRWRLTACPTPDGGPPIPPSACTNGVVLALSGHGLHLQSGTYLASDGSTRVNAIAMAPDGTVVATGDTTSPYLPATRGAYQPRASGAGDDAFVVRLAPRSGRLLACTYLGGGGVGVTHANALLLRPDGSVLVGGDTAATDLAPSFARLALAGGPVGFVASLDAALRQCRWATYLGGSGSQEVTALAGGAGGSLWVAGSTGGTDFPTSPGATQRHVLGASNAFVAHVRLNDGTVIGRALVGGSGAEQVTGLAVTPGGQVVVAGRTTSGSFALPAASQFLLKGSSDAFVAVLAPDGERVLAGRLLGGSEDDTVQALTLEPTGALDLAGSTQSPDFPAGPADGMMAPIPVSGPAPITPTAFIARLRLLVPARPLFPPCGRVAVAVERARAAPLRWQDASWRPP
jgi:hypothetical protein